MIKTQKGEFHCKGSVNELCADLSIIVNILYNKAFSKHMTQKQAKELILKAVEQGLMTEEEIDGILKNSIGDFFESLAKFMKGEGDK